MPKPATPPAVFDKFIDVYRQCGVVSHAADAAGISRRTIQRKVQDDPEFAERFKTAKEDAVDGLELEARKRAFAGSDTLLIFLLKGARPEKYKERIQTDANVKLNVVYLKDLVAHVPDNG